MTTRTWKSTALLLALTTLVSSCRAAPQVVDDGLGAPAAVFERPLQDLRGKVIDPAVARSGGGLVFAFVGANCPISKLHRSRLAELSRRYAERGVRFVALASNASDGLEALRGLEQDLGFPLVRDAGNRLADLLGAERCTEMHLFDRAGRRRYVGALDDQYSLEDGKASGTAKSAPEFRGLEEALEAVLGGREVKVPRTPSPGCLIARFASSPATAKTSYYRDIEPIFQRRCQDCHRPGEIGPFSLLDFEEAIGWTAMIREVVDDDRMPPWHADPRYGEFSNDRRLSAAEKSMIEAWIDEGSPAGEVRDRPAPRAFDPGWRLGEPDLVLEMPEAFVVPPTGQIPYHHVVLDPKLTEDRFVEGIEIRAGAREVVHHIMVFAVDLETMDASKYAEFEGGKNGYFGLFVPGEEPTFYPQGMAKRLPKGHEIVMTIHYQPNGKATADRSKIGLHFAKKPPEKELFTGAAYEDDLLVLAPNSVHTRIYANHLFSKDTWITSFMPHMHYRGVGFQYEAHYPAAVTLTGGIDLKKLPPHIAPRFRHDPATGVLSVIGWFGKDVVEKVSAVLEKPEDAARITDLQAHSRSEILLRVPRYDFGWQNTYRLKQPKRMPKGTLLACYGDFDNSTLNPALTAEMAAEEVRWGLQSTDEMMLGYFDAWEE